MSFVKYKTTVGKTVELTNERKNYFLTKHPELKRHFAKIKNVLFEPDEIRRSKRDEQVLLFYKYFAKIKNGKYIAVVVRINERNFILTTYITNEIKAGRIYEQKN